MNRCEKNLDYTPYLLTEFFSQERILGLEKISKGNSSFPLSCKSLLKKEAFVYIDIPFPPYLT
jgi:hypothetical protein